MVILWLLPHGSIDFSAHDVPLLRPWCEAIRDLLFHFPSVIFKHIYREHNSLADGLSNSSEYGYGNWKFNGTLDGLE